MSPQDQPGGRRIALLLPDLRCGGVERMRVNVGSRFLALGHAVDFVLLRLQGELLAEIPPGARAIGLEAPRFRHALRPLIRYLRDSQPDAVLADMWPLTSIAIAAKRLANSPTRVVVSDHSVLSLTAGKASRLARIALRMSLRLFYPAADARIAVSNGVASDLAKLSRLGRSDFDVIYNPAAILDGSDDGEDPWRGFAGKRILAVGTLKKVKDHATLIRAFAQLRRTTIAKLVILGEGSLRGELENLVAELGLGEDVSMPGFVLNTGPWYRGADLFVLSSLQEGFGNVLVEAMQAGVPVVSTDCPFGPREVLADGRYGRLVEVGRPAPLAAAMLQSLSEAPDRALLRARAEQFSINAATDSYLKLLLPDWVSEPQ